MPPQAKARCWSVTIPCRGEEVRPQDPDVSLRNGLLYFVFQLESCPLTGRLHFQGAFRFNRPVSMSQVKSHIGIQYAHCEPAHDWRALIDYCKKEATRVEGPWEGGESGSQGKRSDLGAVVEVVRGGGGLAAVAQQHPHMVLKFSKGLSVLDSVLNPPPPRTNQKVFLLVGGTGTGKTSICYNMFPDLYSVFCMKAPWFDGYHGQSTILLDEMGPDMMSINFLKKLLDIYPLMLPVKGASTPCKSSCILITSNYAIGDWYRGAGPTDQLALARRVRIFVVENFSQAAVAEAEIRQSMGLLQSPALPSSPQVSSTERVPQPLVPARGISAGSGVPPLPRVVNDVLSVFSSSSEDDDSDDCRPLEGLV